MNLTIRSTEKQQHDDIDVLNILCDEILLKIFRNLDPVSLLNIAKVNNRFYRIVKDRELRMKEINLANVPLKTEDICKILLTFASSKTTRIEITGVVDPPRNRYDYLLKNAIKNETFAHLSRNCINLKSLTIRNCSFTGDIVDFPSTLRSLKILDCAIAEKVHSENNLNIMNSKRTLETLRLINYVFVSTTNQQTSNSDLYYTFFIPSNPNLDVRIRNVHQGIHTRS